MVGEALDHIEVALDPSSDHGVDDDADGMTGARVGTQVGMVWSGNLVTCELVARDGGVGTARLGLVGVARRECSLGQDTGSGQKYQKRRKYPSSDHVVTSYARNSGPIRSAGLIPTKLSCPCNRTSDCCR